ncbi:hypothetical protein FHR99_002069 [Litorivivens lipolytica]|uniref:Bacteriophage N4 adsorption protein B n=1 Tax=Litorivivens lipolytica TaxID=1524264 RepID=A0A7W4W655_9GAMM|nr:hypothetical protein [Litorivivens lipolytica]MBB3047803.1 hypothetical protein [Litorivivens lipolytica]
MLPHALTSSTDPSRIGDLLVAGGFISRRELQSALSIASRHHVPLCQVLQRQRRLDRLEKNALLKLQDHLRSPEQHNVEQLHCRLGDLLLAEGQIKPEELQAALEQHKASRVPLGMVLLKRGSITLKALTRFLRLQQKLIAAACAALLAMGNPCFADTGKESEPAWGTVHAAVKKASPHSLNANWLRPGFNDSMAMVRYAPEDTLFRSKSGKMELRLTDTGVEFRKFF